MGGEVLHYPFCVLRLLKRSKCRSLNSSWTLLEHRSRSDRLILWWTATWVASTYSINCSKVSQRDGYILAFCSFPPSAHAMLNWFMVLLFGVSLLSYAPSTLSYNVVPMSLFLLASISLFVSVCICSARQHD